MRNRLFTSGSTYIIAAIVSAIWILFAEAFNVWGIDLFSFLSPKSAKLLSWGIFFVFAITAMVIPNLELHRISKGAPRIVIAGTKLEKPFPLRKSGVPTEFKIERYFVMFRNIKSSGAPILDTTPAHAAINFYDMECNQLKHLSHEKPFWLGSSPPWERPLDYGVTIKASGKQEGLCLVVRKQGNRELYVFSDESYNLSKRSLEPFQESLSIPLGRHYICIELSAANLDLDTFWILLINRGEDKEPGFEIVSSPLKA